MEPLINNKSGLKYMPFENPNIMSKEENTSFFPVNSYQTNQVQNIPKDMSYCERFWRCLLCKSSYDDIDSPEDNSTSALVGASRKSYTVYQESSSSPQANEDDLPKLIVTRPIDDEVSISTQTTVSVTRNIEDELAKSTTKLLLATEKKASSISLSSPKKIQKQVSSSNGSLNESNSNGNTLKSGEKMSFLQDVLSCRDSFLKSLEWCDNSLTRGKRYRTIKKDDWIQLNDVDGIKYETYQIEAPFGCPLPRPIYFILLKHQLAHLFLYCMP